MKRVRKGVKATQTAVSLPFVGFAQLCGFSPVVFWVLCAEPLTDLSSLLIETLGNMPCVWGVL